MQYYSTNGKSAKVDFKEATIAGQAPDKGLYFPEYIPQFPNGFINNLNSYSKTEIGVTVMKPFVGDTIPAGELERIVSETTDFDFPLVKVTEAISSLELFHGPTLAFKDVGARFMSRCLGYFVKDLDKKVTVLVATSGDTGGAVANGFHNVDGVDVIILYPSGKVSNIQELQLTTLGGNIRALEIDGSFDDCQAMVKDAFIDQEIRDRLFLTSANSINVARWLPQQLYYFFAYQQWQQKDNPPVVSVPSGNFGNICAGLLAYRSGLPVSHFIAACNANDVVPEYLETGKYEPKKTVHTLSNAMDVGSPSNFVRILHLFNNHIEELREVLTAFSISDSETEETIKRVFDQHHYILDPHGAVGFLALEKYLKQEKEKSGYFCETAHPIKFYDAVEKMVTGKLSLPDSVKELMMKEKEAVKMKADILQLKAYLMEANN